MRRKSERFLASGSIKREGARAVKRGREPSGKRMRGSKSERI